MPVTTFQSIIIVGAGPVGLCCALSLAQAGHRVTVVDSGQRGAGWASGGMLGAVYETLGLNDVPVNLTDLAFESLALWHDLAVRLDIQTLTQTLFVGRTQGEVDFLMGLAVNSQAAMTPKDLPEGIVGLAAWQCARDLALDPRATLRALRAACTVAGVTFVQAVVAACSTNQITLGDGTTLRPDIVILATGQASGSLRESVAELAHIVPVKGQMLALADGERGPRSVVRAGRLYLIPRGDQIVIGATSTSKDTDLICLDQVAHAALHADAIALCPALQDAPIVESWAGLRPMTRDGSPMLGHSSINGVMLACGTYRNGWLLAPAVAQTVTALVQGNAVAASKLQSFSPLRFPI